MGYWNRVDYEVNPSQAWLREAYFIWVARSLMAADDETREFCFDQLSQISHKLIFDSLRGQHGCS